MTTYHEYTYTSKNDPLKLTEATFPTTIAADEVLVKVHSASLNPVDALVYNSSYGALGFLTGKMGTGRDYSGVVEKVGADVTAKLGIKQGDRVVGLYRHFFQKGTLAEFVLVKPFSEADQAFSKVPETLTMEQAASFPLVLLTAFSMTEGHKLENSKILVLGGATSVGRYVIQLAQAAGAASIVTTNSARSNELVQSLGSTAQIDYHQHKSLRDPVLEAAKSAPFNYVYDCAGNDQLFGIMSKIVDPNDNGYVTIVGEHHYDYKNEHGLGLAYMSMKTKVRGLASCLGLLGYKYRFDMMKPRKAWFDKGFQMFNSGELKPFVDTVYKFEESPEAWEKLVSGTASGKIVVNVNPAV